MDECSFFFASLSVVGCVLFGWPRTEVPDNYTATPCVTFTKRILT